MYVCPYIYIYIYIYIHGLKEKRPILKSASFPWQRQNSWMTEAESFKQNKFLGFAWPTLNPGIFHRCRVIFFLQNNSVWFKIATESLFFFLNLRLSYIYSFIIFYIHNLHENNSTFSSISEVNIKHDFEHNPFYHLLLVSLKRLA